MKFASSIIAIFMFFVGAQVTCFSQDTMFLIKTESGETIFPCVLVALKDSILTLRTVTLGPPILRSTDKTVNDSVLSAHRTPHPGRSIHVDSIRTIRVHKDSGLDREYDLTRHTTNGKIHAIKEIRTSLSVR